jgi:hypothetical protein
MADRISLTRGFGLGALASLLFAVSCGSEDDASDGAGGGQSGSSGKNGSGGSMGGAGGSGTGGSGTGGSGTGGSGTGGSGTGGSSGSATGGASGSGTGGTGAIGGSGGANGNSTEPNLKIAFVGDQGAGTDARAVYQTILDEGAALTVVLGDFDYQNNPDLWESDIDAVLGADYPIFGVVGNHDTTAWTGYQQKLSARIARIPEASCSGDVGNMQNCKYRGLRVVLSGIGTMGSDSAHETFLEDALAADPDSLWKFCGWHQNQNDMQLGTKGDAIGWRAFEICQAHAAIIGMGHEHTYGRTFTLTDVGNEAAEHGKTGAPGQMDVSLGSTFVFYNGLGGSDIRDYSPSLHDDDTWWATMYCADKNVKNEQDQPGPANFGALFLVFNVDGDPSKARGYFKNIDGVMVDEFTIIRN